MGKDDLQIGGLWTEPNLRGRGLAAYAVHEILRTERRREQTYWYVVDELNLPSIRVAQRNGFRLYGRGCRRPWIGINLLSYFSIDEVVAPRSPDGTGHR